MRQILRSFPFPSARLLYVFFVFAVSGYGTEFPRVILRGDYPDPTILRDGSDYYMTHSPFYYTPGFLIWHSRDLINWEPVGRAMSNVVGSAMAPDLVKYHGRYYIYFPAASVNWVIWADDIRGPWSKPIQLNVDHIDPGHAVGEDGKRYLYLSDGYVVPLSDDGLAVAGPKAKAYSGWEFPKTWSTEGLWLESPKLFRKDGYFYLVSAEGGTAGPATSHMIVVARSKSIHGPWENSPYNPIIHTYTDTERWWSKGHGTLVDDVDGNWWVVYHAYEKGQYPLGRQTLLDPIAWTNDGWPTLAETRHSFPGGEVNQVKRSVSLSDDFAGRQLGWQWMSWRDYSGVSVGDGILSLQAQGKSPADARLLLVTAIDPSYEVEAEIDVTARGQGGLVLFYNEKAFAGLLSDGKDFVLYRDATESTREANRFGNHFSAKIINRNNRCDILASADGKRWTTVLRDVDVTQMHHNQFKGFFALRPGLVAAGRGEVKFRHFVYDALPADAAPAK